jgi:chromosome partitioning protein
MRSILIANPKGGCGKTTLATNLAGHLAKAGRQVMLGDIDRLQAARQWLKLRGPELAPIRSWDIDPGDPQRPARPPKGTSHVVLDSPAGLHGKKLAALLKLVDRVLVPLQPSLFDMLATGGFLDALAQEKAVRNGGIPIAIVGMRVDARTRSAQELERFLARYELPVLSFLRDTQLYVQAAAHGLTVFDLPPSRVERDLEQWRPIAEWVGAQD